MKTIQHQYNQYYLSYNLTPLKKKNAQDKFITGCQGCTEAGGAVCQLPVMNGIYIYRNSLNYDQDLIMAVGRGQYTPDIQARLKNLKKISLKLY